MTLPCTREDVAAWILESRRAQGLPPTIDNPAAQQRVLAALDRLYAARAAEALRDNVDESS